MTFIKELPKCKARFGRTILVEKCGILIPRCSIACGYREVEPEECIMCGGFTGVLLELKIDTFIRITGKVNLKI